MEARGRAWRSRCEPHAPGRARVEADPAEATVKARGIWSQGECGAGTQGSHTREQAEGMLGWAQKLLDQDPRFIPDFFTLA